MKRLFVSAKNRGIAIPLDLESQVTAMFSKTTILTRQTSKWLQASKAPKMERSQSQVGQLVRYIPIQHMKVLTIH